MKKPEVQPPALCDCPLVEPSPPPVKAVPVVADDKAYNDLRTLAIAFTRRPRSDIRQTVDGAGPSRDWLSRRSEAPLRRPQ